VLNPHVTADRVATPTATTESERRIEAEVVKIANGSHRRGSINQYPPYFYLVFEVLNVLIIIRIGIDNGSMSLTPKFY
jgi:hypothetical protein